MKNKYVFLRENSKAYFLKYIKDANIQNYYKINIKGIFFKIIIRFNFERDILFGDWKYDVRNYDFFILSENNYSLKITDYIRRYNPNARIIIFFWNCVGNTYKKILSDPNIDEFWSYDRNDVKKYNMKYNSQFYSKTVKLPKRKIINDIFFCGRDKGRRETLNELKKEFDKQNLKTNLMMIKKEREFISYDKYLKLLSESKAILDLFSRNQIGLSLRCMESIFLEKKLITNNQDLINYDFYDPNNIFIIGKDDINKLSEFLNTDYKKIDRKIVEQYDFEQWLKRFYN